MSKKVTKEAEIDFTLMLKHGLAFKELTPNLLFVAKSISVSPAVSATLNNNPENVRVILTKHYKGEWGKVSLDQRVKNDEAYRERDGFMLSIFEIGVAPDTRDVYVLTEHNNGDCPMVWDTCSLFFPEERQYAKEPSQEEITEASSQEETETQGQKPEAST